jgi:RNA polymerase primary sigma factor
MNCNNDVLPNEEIVSLLKEYKKTKSIEARDKIIFANLKFVYSIAHKYKRSAEIHGSSLEDLISDGILGLIEAIDKFEIDRDVKFLTYAYWWILKKITEKLSGGNMELPYHRRRALKDYEDLMTKAIEAGVDFDPDKACKEIGVSKKIIMDSMSKKDTAPYGKDRTKARAEALASAHDVEDHIVDNMLYDDIKHMIDHDLEPKERKIIIERFGLDGVEIRTLDQIAKDLDISYEYVRTIQIKAVGKLTKFANRKNKITV